uniref:Cd8 beta n=1 Tax=Cyprinus carpio carpio TaxID=630221 RepID=A0A8C1HB83_CYPCA
SYGWQALIREENYFARGHRQHKLPTILLSIHVPFLHNKEITDLPSVLPTLQAKPSVLYTKINGSEVLTCECKDHSCQEVFWYRYLERTKTLQFLVYVNSAGREKHGDDLNGTRFKGSVSSGQKVVYTLRITGLQEDEIGIYSCMFKAKNLMPVGYYIMPGVNPPTVQPLTVKTKKPVKICNCKPSSSPKGCEQLVLWPGIGALLLLAITLAGTLYYFSRLPKKCRHRFTKTNPLR